VIAHVDVDKSVFPLVSTVTQSGGRIFIKQDGATPAILFASGFASQRLTAAQTRFTRTHLTH
jgi:hypothetical protein